MYSIGWWQRLGIKSALFLQRFKAGRKIMEMLVALWGLTRGKQGVVEFLTGLLGLTFSQFGLTDNQMGTALKTAVIEHQIYVADPDGTPPPAPAYLNTNWQDFTTGLEKIIDGVGQLFVLPEDVTWQAVDLAGDRFLARP
jgi:hypothetical protein